MKSKVLDLLTDSNCQFLFDSDNVSPFSENSMTNKFILEVNDSMIELRQKDCRDFYFVYELFKNEKKVLEIDISNLEIEHAVESAIGEIKKILERK